MRDISFESLVCDHVYVGSDESHQTAQKSSLFMVFFSGIEIFYCPDLFILILSVVRFIP